MNKIEPQYVTFEQSKWLKEKGFDVPCQYLYIAGKYRINYEKEGDLFNNGMPSLQIPNEWYLAPEQHVVVEWLRVNHGFWISVRKIDGFQDLYYYTITGSNGFKNGHIITVEEWDDEMCDKMGYNNKYFNSPQEAYSAAFDYIKEKELRCCKNNNQPRVREKFLMAVDNQSY